MCYVCIERATLPVSVLQGERFVYHEGWGERLNTRSAPVLCMLDIKSSSVSVLESVPEHVSPGQVGIGRYGTALGAALGSG